MDVIPYGRQDIQENDIQAVLDVLKSDFLTQGPAIPKFEQAVARFTNAPYAIAVSNATAALHIGALALGLGKGDLLWTSPNTFVASANCALYCGADVDFVDIDPQTYNLSVSALKLKLEQAAKTGRLPKILVPVHFSGQPCAMREISELCRQYGVAIMEDASHAIGATVQGSTTGDCEYADLTVFSFHPVKILTTGEGGLLMTRRADLYEELCLLRSHGITREPHLMEGTSHGGWYYQQVDLGFNYRMTDIQAALGASQMERLPQFLEKRRALVKRYNELLADLPLCLPWQLPETDSAWHLYVVQVDSERTQVTRAQLFSELRAAGIYAQVHYIPVHTQPWYRKLGFKDGDFPVAENYYQRALSLPLYYGLTEEKQDRVVAELRKILG